MIILKSKQDILFLLHQFYKKTHPQNAWGCRIICVELLLVFFVVGGRQVCDELRFYQFREAVYSKRTKGKYLVGYAIVLACKHLLVFRVRADIPDELQGFVY